MFKLANKTARDLNPGRQLAGRHPTTSPQVLNAFAQVHEDPSAKLHHNDFRISKNC
jgi:hypothetical protein